MGKSLFAEEIDVLLTRRDVAAESLLRSASKFHVSQTLFLVAIRGVFPFDLSFGARKVGPGVSFLGE